MKSLLSLGKYWAIEPDTFNNLEALVSKDAPVLENIRGSKSRTKTIRSSVFRLLRQLPGCWLNPITSAVSGGLPPIRPSTASLGYPNRLTLL